VVDQAQRFALADAQHRAAPRQGAQQRGDRASAAATAAAYPEPARTAYVNACVGSTPGRQAFCECTLTELQRTMPWAEFRQVGQAALNGDAAARQRYAAVVLACAAQAPRAGA
jgi:hypothetical protein